MMRLAVLSGMAVTAVSASEANPIRRVVTLLQDMRKEIEAEAVKEEKLYNKFMCFCKGNAGDLDKNAEEAAAKLEELNAKVKADQAEKAQLVQDLAQHKKDRANAKQDLATATKLREKEHNEYLASAGDTKQNIDAIAAAIPALEKGMGASFLQSSAGSKLRQVITNLADASGSPADRETVLSFLSESGDYVPASGQIVGILKNMRDTFKSNLASAIASEKSSLESYEVFTKVKNDEHAKQKASFEDKEKIMAGFDWLLGDVEPGDELFFQYSGHGSQMPDRSGTESDGKNECLCPVDCHAGPWPDYVILDNDIYDIFYNRLADGVKCVCVFDCCHSGTMADLQCTRAMKPPVCEDDAGDDGSRWMDPPEDMKEEIGRAHV